MFTLVPAREVTRGSVRYDERHGRRTITIASPCDLFVALGYADGTGSVHKPDAEILVETPDL